MVSCKAILLCALLFCLVNKGVAWGRKRRTRVTGCLFGSEPNKECHYSPSPKYSECDEETQTYTKSYLLENGPDGCDLGYVTIQRCLQSIEPAPCKYMKDYSERWSFCDEATFTKTRKMILESGGAHCPSTTYKTKPCRKHRPFRHQYGYY